MKFSLSWLKTHLRTDAGIHGVAEAMTMAGLEVEEVLDPGAALAPFSVARILEARPHPDADRLQVCLVETRDGMKEIVCGAPNARAGLTTIYAPIGAYVPGLGVTLVEKPVRGVVSNGMLCSASELEQPGGHDGIMELDAGLAVGTPAAEVFAAEPVIDFEVTPNRPDWLGVEGIARDLAATGLGQVITQSPEPVEGRFACPVSVRIEAPDLCPVFAGRVLRGVRNGPSPQWLQQRLTSIGLRPINALVDITNLIAYDRARPLHVYDLARLGGSVIVAREGRDEAIEALDQRTYSAAAGMCVIADQDGARAIGLGGVMGGESTGCTEATVDVFIESAWFDPLSTARTGRALGISSDAQYRFARGVDPASVLPGLELATRLILDICGGEASEVVVAGQAPALPAPFDFDPGHVARLSGLTMGREGVVAILERLGFQLSPAGGTLLRVQPPSWRRDAQGPADLVEEVARIAGYDQLPATPLPEVARPAGGVLSLRQSRIQRARRYLAARGYGEAITWSFTSREAARAFGGGSERLVLENPISPDLDCMRPTPLPNLIRAAQRNADRGRPDLALFEIGPVYGGDQPEDQKTVITALVSARPPRHWAGQGDDPLFALKADLMGLMDVIGAPTASLQLVQGSNPSWWHPGRSARLQLGPKGVMAHFGALHPGVLKGLDAEAPLLAFEIVLDAVPEPRARTGKSRGSAALSPLMPLTRDFAFVVDESVPAQDLIRAVSGADKALIREVRVFDVYRGERIGEGKISLALEVVIEPSDATLTEAEIEALSSRIVAAAGKVGASLRA